MCYSTGNAASKYTIRSFKRRRCSDPKGSHSLSNPTVLDTDSDSEEENIEEYNYGGDERVDQNDIDIDSTYSSTRRRNKSAIGTRLVT
ncbi:Hypothetical predicted protein [Octopus vulgaris]|uniref:Uncharacterized protein n=1 Tax=Octopus vulgaris TaxID=6645 RepID=A0AA36FAS3_OCTVU|nr:Hypothetical predicted protein [Octopus vulgaris]